MAADPGEIASRASCRAWSEIFTTTRGNGRAERPGRGPVEDFDPGVVAGRFENPRDEHRQLRRNGEFLNFRPATMDPTAPTTTSSGADAPIDMFCHVWSTSHACCAGSAATSQARSACSSDGGDIHRPTTNPVRQRRRPVEPPDGRQFASCGTAPDPCRRGTRSSPSRSAPAANVDGSHVRQVVPYGTPCSRVRVRVGRLTVEDHLAASRRLFVVRGTEPA
jgi:hypothetical protein